MPPMHTLQYDQLDDIVWDGVRRKPTLDLIAQTATLALVLDVRAQVDIAAGGGADGVLNVESTQSLIKKIRIYDQDTTPIIEISGRELFQVHARRALNPQSGVDLANTGVQAGTQIRCQMILPLSDRWTANSYEVHLRPRQANKFKLEIEWPDITQAGVAAVLNTGGTRVITISNYLVKVMQIHDPIAFLKKKPLYVPRIRSYDKDAPGVSAAFPVKIDSGAYVRWSLIHALNNDVTSEAIINKIGLRDDQRVYRNAVEARAWHEREQALFGGVQDVTGVDMGYFFEDFADGGKLSNIFAPGQGGNPRWIFDLTGGANRIVRLVNLELERVPGLTADDSEMPAGLK